MRAVLSELERRSILTRLVDEACFSQQIAFINDPSKRKYLFTPRRSGKSTALGWLLAKEAIAFAGRKSVYCGLTGETAQNAIWPNVLEKALDRIKMRYKFNHSTRLLTLSNGSRIQILGVDSSPKQMNKFLGDKMHLAALDECQSYTQDIRTIIKDKLAPAVADYVKVGGGTICLGGTPGDSMGTHFWYQLTRDDSTIPGWSRHRWTALENPHMREEVLRVWAELETNDSDYREDPSFRAQWLGEWVTDSGISVYKFDLKKNRLSEGERETIRSILAHERKWRFVVGIDLGWEDASAVVVVAYTDEDPRLFVVEAWKKKRATYEEVGGKLVEVMALYNPRGLFCDMVGGGKQFSESIMAKYKVPLIMADKSEKQQHVARMNTDFRQGKILTMPGTCNELEREWLELRLDAKTLANGEWKEAKKYDNHAADAALYAWRHSLHYLASLKVENDGSRPAPAPPRRVVPALTSPSRATYRRGRDIFDAVDALRVANGMVFGGR